MNQVRRHDRYDEERERIRAIVAQHPMPDFMTGFDVELSEFDGSPIVYVTYDMDRDLPPDLVESKRRVDELIALQGAVLRDILDKGEDRFAVVRTRVAEVKAKAGH